MAKSGDPLKLRRVPELHTRHKEPDDKWGFMTNIPIEFDKEMDAKGSQETQTKSSKYNQKVVYPAIKELKSKKGKATLSWQEICQEMAKKQKNGEIIHHSDFSTVKLNTMIKTFANMKNLFEVEGSDD